MLDKCTSVIEEVGLRDSYLTAFTVFNIAIDHDFVSQSNTDSILTMQRT